jgi:ABC-2 type transport system permease protein
MWLTVNYLGEPDNGVILAGYLGSWILSGAFLAIGSCISAATSNQVLAFIGTVVIGFVFVIAGFTPVTEFLKDAVPAGVIDALAGLSFLTRFEAIAKGVLDVRDVLFFLFTIAGWLVAAAIVIDMKKGG